MNLRRTFGYAGIVSWLFTYATFAATGAAWAQDAKPAAPAASEGLPLPDPAFTGKIGTTYADSTPNYPMPLRAPKGSPNVLLILLDDVGFGMASTFGGPVPTPHMDQPARKWTEIHAISYDGPVQPDSGGAIGWPQPSQRRHQREHRNGHRISRIYGHHSQEHGAGIADAARSRLCNGHVRQMAQYARA